MYVGIRISIRAANNAEYTIKRSAGRRTAAKNVNAMRVTDVTNTILCSITDRRHYQMDDTKNLYLEFITPIGFFMTKKIR